MGDWDVVSTQPSTAAPPSYDTALSPGDEQKFRGWKQKYAPNDTGADYDLRGAYKAGLTPDPQRGHWPDTFKKPNHPTFSDQSQYSKGDVTGGHWGEDDSFTPSPTNLQQHSAAELQQYFKKNEPASKLNDAPQTAAGGWNVVAHAPTKTSLLDDVGETLHQYWSQVNPAAQAQGAVAPVLHPQDTYHGYVQQQQDLLHASGESFKKGEYSEGVRHGLMYMLNGIPGVGALLDRAGNKAGAGDYKGAVADTAALATLIGEGKILHAGTEAATEPGVISDPTVAAGDAVKRGAQATVVKVQQAAGALPAPNFAEGAVALSGHPQVAAGIYAKRAIPRVWDAIKKPVLPAAADTGQAVGPATPMPAAAMRTPQFEDVPDVARTAGPEAPPTAGPPRTTRPVGAPQPFTPNAMRTPQFEDVPDVAAWKVVSHEPTTAPAAIPRAETLKPEIAKTLQEGARRVNPDGSTQVLQRVAIDKVASDPGNVIYPDVVGSFQRNGYSVHPELRADESGGLTVQEGHHRLAADVKNGKTDALAWAPEGAATPVPEPTTASLQVNNIPPAKPEVSAETFAAQNRAPRVQKFADYLEANKVPVESLKELPADSPFWKTLGEAVGIKSPSAATVADLLAELGHRKVARAPKAAPTMMTPSEQYQQILLRNPAALSHAQNIADLMR